MPAQWDKVKEIFLDAAELPESQRAAFLAEACAGDDELQQSVIALLAQRDATGTVDILPVQARHGLAPGDILSGRFKIKRFAGAGGMGEVYEAEDLELGGTLALKTLRPSLLEDQHFLSRFRREVQLARQVTHPNICRIFDVGNDQGRAYLTMEFLDGETLGAHLRRQGRFSGEGALPLVRQIAWGLGALHAEGIVHRDLKPGNILLSSSSTGSARAVITDFGLARAAAATGESNLSMSGGIMGTPDYMSPEQLRGESVTPASDIYAFGLILYEMVTGRKAYPGGQALENAVQRLLEPPPPPRQQAADVTPEWEAVILRCLERDPALRPASAQAVLEGLTGSLAPAPRKPMPRRVWMAWAAGIFLLIVAAFFLGSRVGEKGTPAAGTQRVALLPLQVLSDEPELRVFALGLMDTVTSRLSQFDSPGARQLLVVPASEVRAQQAATASDAAKKFGVTAAVEGTLQGQGDRVRLLLTLIDTARKVQLETITIEEPRGNSMRLQDAAVARLANALDLRLQPRYAREQQEMSPVEPGAYEYYLQARGYLQRTDQPQNVKSAVELLNRALSVDAKFALAHASLGEARVVQYNETRDPKFMEQALQSGQQGLALNPNVAGTQISMGSIHLGVGRYADAQHDFEKALELDSRNSDAHIGLAKAYEGQKDFAKAEATHRKAISLRPGDWTGYKALGLFHYNRGEFQKSIENWKRVIDLNPDNGIAYLNMGTCYARQEDWAQAEKLWLKALELRPADSGIISNLGKAYLETGRFAEAATMYSRALQTGGERGHRVWGNLGNAEHKAGREDKAQEAWQKAATVLEKDLLVNPQDSRSLSSLAFYRALVRRADYRVPLERSLQLTPTDNLVLQQAAETSAIVGDRPRAIDLLGRAFEHGYARASAKRSEYLRDLLPLINQTQTRRQP